MNDTELRTVVSDALKRIAPEVDLSRVAGHEDLREALDLDSMDFLNFIVELHARLRVDIPETEYRKFYTLDGCVSELRARVGAEAAT